MTVATETPAPARAPAAAQLRDWPYRFEVLHERVLEIDEAYQRPLSRFAEEIAELWNPALVGVLVTSRRSPKHHAVIDGQTRLAAARRVGERHLPCLVYTGLTVANEAELFALFQSQRRPIRPVHRFRAEVVSGHPRAVAIARAVEEAGCTITENSGKHTPPSSISAVRSLERIHDSYGIAMLERTLSIVRSAWPADPQALVNEVLLGVSLFLHKERPDEARLVRQLANVTPGELLARSAALRTGRGVGGGSPGYMAEAIMAVYRRRRPQRRPQA